MQIKLANDSKYSEISKNSELQNELNKILHKIGKSSDRTYYSWILCNRIY